MTRSSKRQARRWIIQELTRCMERRGEPLPSSSRHRGLIDVLLAGPGDIRHMECQIRARAKALCVDDGFDPDLIVTHAYGDDFTAQEWESWGRPTRKSPPAVVSPMWRLYRAHAFIELSHPRRWSSPATTSSSSGEATFSLGKDPTLC